MESSNHRLPDFKIHTNYVQKLMVHWTV